jgi:hypothetical protein
LFCKFSDSDSDQSNKVVAIFSSKAAMVEVGGPVDRAQNQSSGVTRPVTQGGNLCEVGRVSKDMNQHLFYTLFLGVANEPDWPGVMVWRTTPNK